VVDSVEQPLGLRYYSVDPDKGFFLNGQPYHLHGVDRHQDRFNKGWAISEADLDEDISLIKEMGCDGHPLRALPAQRLFLQPVRQGGHSGLGGNPAGERNPNTPQFEETSRNQLLDLIRQNVNHPSIFVWSLFNEIRGSKGSDDPHRELQDLKITANGEDPTRPTIAATCVSILPEMNKIPDLLGWNIYPGWYSGWGQRRILARCSTSIAMTAVPAEFA
jgi:beta-galactosidase